MQLPVVVEILAKKRDMVAPLITDPPTTSFPTMYKKKV